MSRTVLSLVISRDAACLVGGPRPVGRLLGLMVMLCALVVACARPVKITTRQYRYPTGELKAEMEEKNYLPHGLGRQYHRSGGLAVEGRYENGAREGVFNYWDPNKNWLKKEFYRHDKLLWSSTDRSEQPPESIQVVAKRKINPLFTTEGVGEPFFLGMRPLILRDGVTLQGSHQQVSRDNNKSRAHNFVLAAAHDLEFLRLPNFVAYGSIGMTAIAFGSQTADEVRGKRNLELGGRWRSSKHGVALSLGASRPVGGDSLNGYRAEVDGGQLGMDSTLGPYPRTTSLRSHAAHVRRYGVVWVRADMGADLVLDTHGAEELHLETSSLVLLRGGAGSGVATERFFFSAQVRALYSSFLETSLANASVAIEMRSFDIRPGLTFYVPLLGEHSTPGAALSLTYDLD